LPHVILSVTNDIATDQRVQKVVYTLQKNGYEVLVVGRKLKDSLDVSHLPFKSYRFRLLFKKKALFYAEYNLRLFFFLLFKKADVLHANDLDTLLANYLVSKIKGIPIVYDSHEYFCYVPELINRPLVQKIWLGIEKWLFPKLKHIITVNNSIARLYEQEYKIPVKVLKNVPFKSVYQNNRIKSKHELGLPENKSIILLQGSGINIHRGAEEAVEAMQYVKNAILLIIGGGDVFSNLEKLVLQHQLMDKVMIKPKMPFYDLIHFTFNATIGLSIDKPGNPNYENSLPNKLFDYIHAGVPVLVSGLNEVKRIVLHYNIGCIIENHQPQHIAEKLNYMLNSGMAYQSWKENCKKAAEENCWENQEHILIDIYKNL
jgi:glycosyltransferase involved in cell wall biosynthesis